MATDNAVDDAAVHVNEVRIRGRVSAEPQVRELPSGDRIATARVVVARPAGPSRGKQTVDVLDCVAWTGRARRLVEAWPVGATVEVEGAIRRRFFRGATGVGSRVEVEVRAARRVSAQPRRA